MKTLLISALLVQGTALFAFDPTPAGKVDRIATAELVSEQDFESIAPYLPGWGGGYGSEYKPATAWKTPFTVALETREVHSGSKSVKITYAASAPGDKTFHTQGIALPANRQSDRIRVRFYYRLTGLPDGSVHFSVMGMNSQTKAKTWLDNKRILRSLSPSDTWRCVEYEGTLGADVQQIQLIWVNSSEAVPGDLFIDDIAVDLLTPNA